MSNIEDIINNGDWSKKFDDITGKDLLMKNRRNKKWNRKENKEILSKDIFSSKHSQFLFDKVEHELKSFSTYHQIKGLIQNTDYEFAKNKVMEDTGMEEKTFERIMASGHMIETMVIFPRVAEYCAEVFKISLEFNDEDVKDIINDVFGKEENNDES